MSFSPVALAFFHIIEADADDSGHSPFTTPWEKTPIPGGWAPPHLHH